MKISCSDVGSRLLESKKVINVAKKSGTFLAVSSQKLDESLKLLPGETIHEMIQTLGTSTSDGTYVSSNKCPDSTHSASHSGAPMATGEIPRNISPSKSHLTSSCVSPVASKSRRTIPSGNYIKLNLRKKCFSRGGTRRQARIRDQIRKGKFAFKFAAKHGKAGKCFLCNQEGHWANKCPKTISKCRVQLTSEELEEMDPDCSRVDWRIVELDEMQNQFPNGPQLHELLDVGRTTLEEDALNKRRMDSLDLVEVRAYMNTLISQMGIQAFRPAQERVIWRTLAGKSTLLILPTAGGKSLCYQIPAAIFQVC